MSVVPLLLWQRQTLPHDPHHLSPGEVSAALSSPQIIARQTFGQLSLQNCDLLVQGRHQVDQLLVLIAQSLHSVFGLRLSRRLSFLEDTVYVS